MKVLIPYRFPLVLGNDLAGDVEAVGVGVTRFKPGDAIYARLDKDRIGAFAEWALVSESASAPKPAGLDYAQAASLPLVGLTARQALIEIGQLTRGQKVLIHAGSGGVVVTVGGVPDGKFARAWGLRLPFIWALTFMTRKISAAAKQSGARSNPSWTAAFRSTQRVKRWPTWNRARLWAK